MKRRDFLKAAGAGAVISTIDWLRFFNTHGLPGTSKSLGLAEAAAAETFEPRFLVYWYIEGGWDGYSMFNPIDTRNDATLSIADGELHPTPDWGAQIFRPKSYDGTRTDIAYGRAKTLGNITYGHLAEPGTALFPELAVVSSLYGNPFHSGGRFDAHYGTYNRSMPAARQADERTVMQAFCEAYGSSYVLPHVSWHRWMADGELSFTTYPEGTGYYEKLGPAHAHTVYGKLPSDMRQRLKQIASLAGNARSDRIRAFVDNLNTNFLADKSSESVRAFASAVAIYKQQVGGGLVIDPTTLFTNPNLREQFGVGADDETATSTVVNDNPARSKESPNINVQAMMTYELMTNGLSTGFFLESREVRGFDTHMGRGSAFGNNGQSDQLNRMKDNLWTPLAAFVNKLKTTPLPDGSGRSYYDVTTIVLASEMGRIMGQVDAAPILADTTKTDAEKFALIMKQDICEHWQVSSAAFLGGTVQGNRQFGRVGNTTQMPIPLLPNGNLDPAFDAMTGVQRSGTTADPTAMVPDAGSVYATALHLTGLDSDALRAAGKGRNKSPALKYIKKA